MSSKRIKVESSRLNASLENRLMSGKEYEVYNKPVMKDTTAKKNNNAPVPIELCLYLLNTDLSYSLSLEELGRYVVILQETFLLFTLEVEYNEKL